MEFVEQLLDSILPGNRFVVQEPELGDALEAQARSDLPPQKWRRAAKRASLIAPGFFVLACWPERRVEDASLLQVRRDLDACDRHEPDAGIVHLSREQLRELTSNLIGDPVGPRTLGHNPPIHQSRKFS